MDDREWEKLFVAAPGEPPPPTFGKSDVLAASQRARAGYRSALLVTCAGIIFALAGTGVLGLVANTGPGRGAVVSAQSGVSGHRGSTPAPPNATGNPDFPTLSPMQGGDGSGKNGPRAESASGCDKVDRELATALAGELSVPVTTAEASPGRVCTTGARSAGFPIQGGMISVTLLPVGVIVQLPPQPAGTAHAEHAATGGGTLLVISTPPAGSTVAPLAGDVGRIADDVALRF